MKVVLNVFTDSPSRGRARLRVSGGHASTVQPPAVNHPQNSCCDQVGPPSIHTQTFTMLMSVHTTQLTSYSLTYLFNTCLNKSFKDFDTTAAFTQNIGNFTFLPPSTFIYLYHSLSLSTVLLNLFISVAALSASLIYLFIYRPSLSLFICPSLMLSLSLSLAYLVILLSLSLAVFISLWQFLSFFLSL